MEFLKKVYHAVAAVLLMLVTSLIYGGYILEWRGKRPLCILIAAMAVTAVLIALVCRYLKKYAGQIAVVCIVPMTFCLATGLYKLYMVAADSRSIFYLAMIFFAAAYFITEYLLNLCMENASLQNIRQFFNTHKWVLILIFIAVLCRVPLLSQLPRWDSGEYYYRLILGTHHFEYTGFKEFVENYALCGHPTLGFCLVYLPGELAFSQEVIGVTLTSLILTTLALWCVYRIFLKILPQVTEGKAAVCTFLLSFSPLFFGMTMYFNPDYALAVFFIFLLYSYVYDKAVLAAFFSLLCFQTKETGLVLVGGLVFGIFIQHIAEKRSHAVKAIFKDVKLYAILAVTLLQLYYTKFIGGIATWTQNGNEEPGLRWDSTGENCLGFQPAFVAVKLKQQFLLNFNWILTAGIVIAVAWWFILKVKGRKKIQASCKICGIAGAFVAFLSFSCLYITASVARYNVAGDVLLCLIFFYCMALFAAELPESTFLKKKYAGMAVTAVFGVLLAGECVFTVDPVTRGLFLKLDTGNTTLCFTGKVSDINSIYYGDYLIYNTQYTYIDKAYDKVLADVDYHPDTTDIYIPDSNGSFICGNLPFYYLNWDEKTKKRVFYENENTQEMEFYNEVKYFSSKMVSEGKDKAVLIVNPYMINVHEEEHLAKLAPYYEIGERKEVKLLQGSIVYYELTRK